MMDCFLSCHKNVQNSQIPQPYFLTVLTQEGVGLKSCEWFKVHKYKEWRVKILVRYKICHAITCKITSSTYNIYFTFHSGFPSKIDNVQYLKETCIDKSWHFPSMGKQVQAKALTKDARQDLRVACLPLQQEWGPDFLLKGWL